MFKKLILFFITATLFSLCSPAYAGLIINEIMYDLSGADSVNSKSREWIEIYNSDTSDVAVNASEWRVYDGSANRTINGEVNFSIPAQSYVIFAGDKDTFLTDYPSFPGTVYDTGITSLNNTGTTLKILDETGSVVDSVTYASTQGGAGDGNSLQKVSGSWIGKIPSPGLANESTVPPTSGTDTTGNTNNVTGGGGGSSATENKNKPLELKKIRAEIIAKGIGFVGTPMIFEGTAYGYSGEQLYGGKYFWNFGDGDSREVPVSTKEKFSHTYFYPGDYVVSLEYYVNSYADIPEASDKIVIKVVSSDVVISNVGDESDFFIELSNNTGYDADISQWILSGSSQSFVFPKNTFLGSKKNMILSPRITNFSIAEKSNLRLLNPEREVMFDYTSSLLPATVVVEQAPIIQDKIKIVKAVELFGKENDTESILDENIPGEDLGALATLSEVDKNNPFIPIVSSIVLIGSSAGAVYFIRRRKITSNAGSDFKILDE